MNWKKKKKKHRNNTSIASEFERGRIYRKSLKYNNTYYTYLKIFFSPDTRGRDVRQCGRCNASRGIERDRGIAAYGGGDGGGGAHRRTDRTAAAGNGHRHHPRRARVSDGIRPAEFGGHDDARGTHDDDDDDGGTRRHFPE